MTIHPPLRDPQTAAPSAYCDKCRGEVYSGETMYLCEDRWLCPDCFKSEIESTLEHAPRTLAMALGLETRRFE